MSAAINFIRRYSIKIKPVVVTDTKVLDDIRADKITPKKHPGIMLSKVVTLPEAFVVACEKALEDRPVKALLADAEKLARHLKHRVPPMEREEIIERGRNIRETILSKYENVVVSCEEEERKLEQSVRGKVEHILKKTVYNWKPINYNDYNSIVYLMCRSAAEYAALVKIFGEISSRDPDFKPKNLFDFGSGVGTGTWAANHYWKKNIFEYFNVDASSDMNDLAQILLKGGRGTGKMSLRGVFYRQFLPATEVTYDLVISAYSMLDLPTWEARFQTLLNLWNRTEKYLVIVEQGTNGGFKVINELRDFVLQIKDKHNVGHVFSPCPHDDTCPRFLLNDGTPCNFEIRYSKMPIGCTAETNHELYSYVILKKGERDKNLPEWPRIVRSTLVRSKHTICRACTAKGKLGEIIFSASKHGKETYQCARASKWGDLLPVKVDFNEIQEENIEDIKNENIDDVNITENTKCT